MLTHRTSLGRLALPTVIALSASASAQLPDIAICLAAGSTPAPQCNDRIIMLRDLDMNGDYLGMPDEIASFIDSGCFDATFLGIRAAEMLLESGVPTIYWVDKTDCPARGTYRGQDLNMDGSISAAETSLFRATPVLEANGVAATADGAIWHTDQNFSPPSAAAGLWRMVDGNMDDDAEDGGEAVQMVASGQTVPTTGGPVAIDTAYFQTVATLGNKIVAYSGTNIMATDECLYAFEDLNTDGDVQDAGEAIIFLNATGKNLALDKNPDFGMGLPNRELATNAAAHARLVNFDVAVQTTNVGTNPTWYLGTDSSQTSPTFSTNINGLSLGGLIFRGVDMNGDGDINDAGEVVTWYDGGFSALNNISKILGLEVNGNSVYVLDLAGGTFSVLQLTDNNNDGDAMDFGEQVIVVDANMWGGASPLGMCGANNGPFVVDFAVIDQGTWPAPGVGVNPFVDFCSGDGGDQMGCTNCPCGNNSPMGTVGGCINSASTSARLIATGDRSVSLSAGVTTDLRFEINGAPGNAFCILNSGDAVAPQGMANPCFGLNSGAQSATFDGLRCAVQNTLRHGGRSADVNGDVGVTNNPWGGEGGPPAGLAVAGGFASGQTRYFQVINRDDPLAVCGRGLNTSQAVELTFTP